MEKFGSSHPALYDQALTCIECFQLNLNMADAVRQEKSLAKNVRAALLQAQTILETSAVDDYSVRLMMSELRLTARKLLVPQS